MSMSLRGELTEQAIASFAHPSSLLPVKLSLLTALGYAITSGSQKGISSVLKESKEFLLNEFDYSGNTPLVGFFSLWSSGQFFRPVSSLLFSQRPHGAYTHAGYFLLNHMFSR
jgi:hypothetical protein